MPSFHSALTLPVDHTLVMTLCKASLIGFSAPFSRVYPRRTNIISTECSDVTSSKNYNHGQQQRLHPAWIVGVEEDRHPQWASAIGVRQMMTTSGDDELLFILSSNQTTEGRTLLFIFLLILNISQKIRRTRILFPVDERTFTPDELSNE